MEKMGIVLNKHQQVLDIKGYAFLESRLPYINCSLVGQVKGGIRAIVYCGIEDIGSTWHATNIKRVGPCEFTSQIDVKT